jgi:hypothetical protein
VLLFQKLPERLKMSEVDVTPKNAVQPWFKKKRFWAIGVIGIFLIMPLTGCSASTDSSDSSSDSASEAPAEPAVDVTAEKLISDLEGNALNAKTTWENKRVRITGIVYNIDASGDYFSLRGDDEFSFTNVTIDIDESLVGAVSAFTIGQKVTVTGTISDVGELMGYSVDAESIP